MIEKQSLDAIVHAMGLQSSCLGSVFNMEAEMSGSECLINGIAY